MKSGKRCGLLAWASILAVLVIAGCGGSGSSTAVPSSISIFYSHGAALSSSNSLMTWGYNAFGQLGDATLTTRPDPRAVSLANVTAVAVGGAHTVARTGDGKAWSWGSNQTGQLGNGSATGSSTNSSSPVQVATATGVSVIAVAAGTYHSLALAADGTVYSWGDNSFGQLGDHSFTQRPTPVQVVNESGPLTGADKIAAGSFHSLALVNGEVWAWGSNKWGQVGVPAASVSNSSFASLVDIPNSSAGTNPVTKIAAAGNFSAALTQDGKVYVWGYNAAGQLGVNPNTTPSTELPQLITIPGGGTVREIAAGIQHMLALVDDGTGNGTGTVWAWGQDFFGQLGNNNKDNTTLTVNGAVFNETITPVQVLINGTPASGNPLTGVTEIRAIGNTSFARNASGLFAWGDNGQGQCGVPSTTTTVGYLQVPTLVPGL